jgi:hypothetical protein
LYNCNICDDCRTRNTERRELVGPKAPAAIPVLIAADLYDRWLLRRNWSGATSHGRIAWCGRVALVL